MTHKLSAALFGAIFLWPSVAAAECDLPPSSASSADLVTFTQCSNEAASRASAARDAMAAKLRDLYQAVEGDTESKLDANQKAWQAHSDASCPPLSNGTITVAASACEEKRYTERSAYLDEILAGCSAGACPVDKL